MIIKKINKRYEHEDYVFKRKAVYLFIFNLLLCICASLMVIFTSISKTAGIMPEVAVLLPVSIISMTLVYLGYYKWAVAVSDAGFIIAIPLGFFTGLFENHELVFIPVGIMFFLFFSSKRTTIVFTIYMIILVFFLQLKQDLPTALSLHYFVETIIGIILFATLTILLINVLETLIARLNSFNKNLEKKVEERTGLLKDAKEYAELLFLVSPNAIFTVNTERKITSVNKKALEILGYSKNEMLGHPCSMMTKFSCNNRCCLYGSEDFVENLANIECTIVTKKGEIRSIIKNAEILYDPEGTVTGAIESFVDITERKKMEIKIKKLSIAVEQNSSTIVITDTKGIIEYVNDSFERATGYTKEEAIGQNPRILKSNHQDDKFYKELWKTISAGKTWKGEFLNKKKDGTSFWEKAVISPITDAAGSINWYVAIKEDITHQKQLEELKINIERMIRHDLKAPLNAIIGFPQLIMSYDNLNDDQKEFLTIILENGKTMLNQINVSLDLYKIEQGTFMYRPENIDIFELIHRVTANISGRANRKKIKIRTIYNNSQMDTSESLFIRTEGTLIFTILSNLLGNAIDASPENAEVTLALENGGYKISINNQGEIPVEIRDRFFEKFITAGKLNGTGLGTYSAKLMTEAMGGELYFETSGERGTTLFICLKNISLEGEKDETITS